MAVTFLESGTDATQTAATFYITGAGPSSSIASATDFSFTGPRALKAVVGASGEAAVAKAPDGIAADAGSAISCRLRLSSVAPATTTALLAIGTAGQTTSVLRVGLDTTGKLRIDGRGVTSKLGTTALASGTWYRISCGYTITSTTNWTFNVYLNGNLEATIGNADGTLEATGTNAVSFGMDVYGGTGSPWLTPAILTAWFDDVYVDNRTNRTSPEAVRVTAKRPNANGTTNGYTTQIGVGGSGYGTGRSPQVNEQPLSETNGWAMASGNAVIEEYNVEGKTVGDVNMAGGTILDTMGWVWTKALVAETDTIIVNGVSSTFANTATPAMFFKMAGSTAYPAGTGTDIGEKTAAGSTTTVSLYECGILVGYIDGHGRLLGQARNRRAQWGW